MKMVKNLEWVKFNILTEGIIMETFLMTVFMGRDFISGLMGKFIQEIGKKIKEKGKVHQPGKMDQHTK